MKQPLSRPFTYLNLAMSADGKITSAKREYPKFTSAADKQTMETLRSTADAILVGAGTVRADDPPMQLRDPEAIRAREAAGRPPGIINVVVSKSARIGADAKFFRAAAAPALIVATVRGANTDHLQGLPGNVEIWREGDGGVDVVALVERLHERGVRRLLVEGGGDLNWQFFSHDLVDEIHITVCPALLGGSSAPSWLDGVGFEMADQRRLELIEARVVGNEIFCHWRVLRSGAGQG